MAKKRPSSTLDYTAENIGTALGKLANRFEQLSRQRAELGGELQRISQAAQRMLADIGTDAGDVIASVTGRRRGGRPKGYKVSAATRAKLKAAWKRRQAAKKAKSKEA